MIEVINGVIDSLHYQFIKSDIVNLVIVENVRDFVSFYFVVFDNNINIKSLFLQGN